MSERYSTPLKSRYLSWLVVVLIVAILGGAISLTTLHLRRAMRQQIIQQDGIALYASTFVQDSLLEGLDPEITSDPELRFFDLANRMFETASRRGALAVRVYDAEGRFQMAMPVPAPGRELTPAELSSMGELKPLSRFQPAADMSDFGENEGTGPVLRALVPLEADHLMVGAAEFILDGKKVAESLAALDRDLWRYSAVTFALGGGIIAVSLIYAFHRLRKTNELLAQRTQSLLRANHELTLAAKTSAVGAIAAHLIHDLKSPLFGLQAFVSARGGADDEDWQIAADTAERMQKLIADTVRILKEENTTERYAVTLEEILTLLKNRLDEPCAKAGIRLTVSGESSDVLLMRDANIVLLILTNLAHNAIQALPQGGELALSAERGENGAVFYATDNGPGIPGHLLKNLFTPCRSTKSGGTGLGLAISKQLANHMGAELLLRRTSERGTTFELRVPEKVFERELCAS